MRWWLVFGGALVFVLSWGGEAPAFESTPNRSYYPLSGVLDVACVVESPRKQPPPTQRKQAPPTQRKQAPPTQRKQAPPTQRKYTTHTNKHVPSIPELPDPSAFVSFTKARQRDPLLALSLRPAAKIPKGAVCWARLSLRGMHLRPFVSGWAWAHLSLQEHPLTLFVPKDTQPHPSTLPHPSHSPHPSTLPHLSHSPHPSTLPHLSHSPHPSRPSTSSHRLLAVQGLSLFHTSTKAYLFVLPKPSDAQVLYVRVPLTSATWWAFRTAHLRPVSSFFLMSDLETALQGLYFGILFAMILFNLFLFVAEREQSHLWYIFFQLAVVGFFFFTGTVAYRFLLTYATWMVLPAWSGNVFTACMLLGNALFGRSFLQSWRYSISADWILRILIGAGVMYLAFALILPLGYSGPLNRLLGLLSPLLVVYVGAACWWRGYRPARYYLFGQSVFMISVMAFVVLDHESLRGIYPWGLYSFQMGSAIEAALFSLALVDRLRLLKQERVRLEQAKEDAEQLAHEHEQRLQLVLDATKHGIWDWHLPSDVLYLSPSYAAMLGEISGASESSDGSNASNVTIGMGSLDVSVDADASVDSDISVGSRRWEVRFERWLEGVHEADKERVRASFMAFSPKQRLDTPPDEHSMEFRFRDKAGRWRWIFAQSTCIQRDITGHPLRIVGIHMDISARKQTQTQMARADKMAALGKLMAGIAHEINNPTNFLAFNLPLVRQAIGAIEPLIEEKAAKDPSWEIMHIPPAQFLEETDKLIEDMRYGTSRIHALVGELKNFVRSHESFYKQPESIALVVEHVRLLAQKQLEKMDVRLIVEVQKDLPRVVIHTGKIEQVLINLLLNAGQAADKKEAWVCLRIASDAAQGRLRIEVEDNGRGIEAEHLEKIFDPFFTTKAEEGGTGLGLAISHEIIREHEGEITVESRVGEGTRFAITLPLQQSGVSEKPESANESHQNNGGTR